MTEFTLHTLLSAPDDSKPLLEGSMQAFGMIPHLHAVMAEAPALLEAYQRVHGLFLKTSLSTVEKNVVWQTINVEHACHYCVPAHTHIALSMGVDPTTSDDLRAARPLSDSKLEALRQFTLAVVRERGQVGTGTQEVFLAAGYTQRQALEVVLGVAQKVMSNYVNHMAHTPVDEAFTTYTWNAPS